MVANLTGQGAVTMEDYASILRIMRALSNGKMELNEVRKIAFANKINGNNKSAPTSIPQVGQPQSER